LGNNRFLCRELSGKIWLLATTEKNAKWCSYPFSALTQQPIAFPYVLLIIVLLVLKVDILKL
jgi:hypothetical protein